jgi:hypothetical protein
MCFGVPSVESEGSILGMRYCLLALRVSGRSLEGAKIEAFV